MFASVLTLTRTRRVASACLIGILAATAGAAALAQARERVVYVSAVDKATEWPVRELAPTDIVVREDGVQREVLRVTRATSPMPVAVIIDNSQAAAPAIPDLRRALAAFLKAIDGVGPVAVFTVADRPTMVVDYTTQSERLQDAVGRLFHAPNSGATLLDAINDVAKGLAKRESDRAAIVVVTTENVEFTQLYSQNVLEALRNSGATMHAVVLVNPKGSVSNEEARQRAIVLDRGPRESGGIRRDVLTSMAFEPTLNKLGAVLKNQYRAEYARPEALIPPEKTEVSAAKPGLEASGAPARGQAKK